MKANLVTLGALFSVLTANSAIAGTLPDGKFEGSGLWKTQSAGGSYQSKQEISGNTISATYTYPEGAKTYQMTLEDQGKGFFTVKVGGNAVGTGYCLEKATVCHYEIRGAGLDVEETITVQENKLYRFGSKSGAGGEKIVWQEAMDRK